MIGKFEDPFWLSQFCSTFFYQISLLSWLSVSFAVPFLALLGPRESTPNVPRIAGGVAGMTAEKGEDKVIIRTAIMFKDGDKMFDGRSSQSHIFSLFQVFAKYSISSKTCPILSIWLSSFE